MRLHFAAKWHININLYRHMIEEQKKNLLTTLKIAAHPGGLGRGGLSYAKL